MLFELEFIGFFNSYKLFYYHLMWAIFFSLQVIPHDVIDIDKGGDSADVMFIDGKVHTRNKLRSNKGKKIKDVSDGYGGHQAKVCD